jgi:hypothetical protein
MKLESKHISPYLPYGLKGIVNGWVLLVSGIDKPYTLSEVIIKFLNEKSDEPIKNFKPILRPLSDLTKEIEVNGEKFVPAGKMITHGFHNSFWYETEKFDYRYLYVMDFEKLLEWHFDVFGLIDFGLAIDINTLND